MTWRDVALQDAKDRDPWEAVGLIVEVEGKSFYKACRNMAHNMKDMFILNPEDYAAAADEGEIVGIFHSHPSTPAVASDADRVSAEKHGIPWYIVNPKTEAWSTYIPCGYKAPLLGRQWSWAVNDCWSLARDWYAEEGIQLRDWERPPTPEHFLQAPMFDGAWAATGFRELAESEGLERGDLLLMNIRSVGLNHCAVYTGDGMVLHHLSERLSTRDMYGGWLQSVTGRRLRYVA